MEVGEEKSGCSMCWTSPDLAFPEGYAWAHCLQRDEGTTEWEDRLEERTVTNRNSSAAVCHARGKGKSAGLKKRMEKKARKIVMLHPNGERELVIKIQDNKVFDGWDSLRWKQNGRSGILSVIGTGEAISLSFKFLMICSVSFRDNNFLLCLYPEFWGGVENTLGSGLVQSF